MSAATISVGTKRPTNTFANYSIKALANKGVGMFSSTLTFDGGTYARGGIAIDLSDKFITVDYLNIEATKNYKFIYDQTNAKVKAYKPMPALIVEEVVTCASNVGTLANIPLYICCIDVTATTTTGSYHVIPVGETPATTECAVNFVTGGLTFLSTDAVTSVRVTYIPAAESGPLSQETALVIDELVTLSASKTDLAFQAAAVQCVYNNTNNELMVLEPVGEAPAATTNAVIDIDDGSDDTNIDCHADDATDIAKVTYLKYSAFPADLCIGDGDTTLTSEAYDFTATLGYTSIVVPGLGTHLLLEETADNMDVFYGGPSVTAAENLGEWHPEKNYFLTNQTGTATTLAMPYIVLDMSRLGHSYYEVPTGEIISAAPTFLAIGKCGG